MGSHHNTATSRDWCCRVSGSILEVKRKKEVSNSTVMCSQEEGGCSVCVVSRCVRKERPTKFIFFFLSFSLCLVTFSSMFRKKKNCRSHKI